jgi:hypothetical protein
VSRDPWTHISPMPPLQIARPLLSTSSLTANHGRTSLLSSSRASSAPARTGCCSSMTTGSRSCGHGSPVVCGARRWPQSRQSLTELACTICGTFTPRCSSGMASRSRRCSPGSGTQQLPRRWTPTRTCGRMRTIRRGQPSTPCSRSISLRTLCGQNRVTSDVSAGHRLGADELACKPDPVRRAPLGSPAGGHPSRPAVAGRLQRPTRRHWAGHPRSPAQHPGIRVPFGLAPGGVYRAVPVTRDAGGLLHHRFTLTPLARGGLFSVALSRGSPRVAVSNHPALRSPDFPRQARRRT